MPQKAMVLKPSHPTDELRTGARRMAEKSASRLSLPEIASQIRVLHRLITTEREAKLKQGDTLVVLIDRHELRAIDIARSLGQRSNDLSQMYYTAKTFPPRVRKPNIPYNYYLMAMRMVRKFRPLNLRPMSVLAEIIRNGLTQHRQVTAHFAARFRQRESSRALAANAKQVSGQILNRCYHARFQNLLNVFPEQSIKIIHCDPPYANYRRVGDGRYCGGSVMRMDCDSATATEAVGLVVDLLGKWLPKLKVGGTLLLWQAAGPLREQIAQAIEQFGWEVEAVVIWDKGRVQAGNFELPYSVQSEWLWVLKRAGDALVNHDNSPRGDILRFIPVNRPTKIADRAHAFEKPLELGHFLIGKHSYEGDLVFDVCACTGTMSVAAMQMNRRWVYCESNRGNFQIGSLRIARLLETQTSVAG